MLKLSMPSAASSIRWKIFASVTAFCLIAGCLIIYLYLRMQDASSNVVPFVLSFVLIIVSGGVIYRIISGSIFEPLGRVSENISSIAKGTFDPRSIDLSDKEIMLINESLKKISLFMSHELDIRQKQLIHTEKLASLGTFLSGIAHELVNPLSNIYSSSQILLEEMDSAEKEYQLELLKQIEQESERARNIARSLLEFSRESGDKKESVYLKNLLEDTLRLISGHKSSKVEIVLDIPGEIKVFVDKQRIQQAFLNLIKNALEAIPSEGRITIIAKEDSDPGFVALEIRDTGAGIPPEVLPRLFDAFFTTKEVGKGSGLGLFITQEIIKENNGDIEVESRPGEGTTFKIKLPGREY